MLDRNVEEAKREQEKGTGWRLEEATMEVSGGH